MKPPTTFRPPQQYKPSFQEYFTNLPSSSFSLLTTLLALEPAYRGTAASALQNEVSWNGIYILILIWFYVLYLKTVNSNAVSDQVLES